MPTSPDDNYIVDKCLTISDYVRSDHYTTLYLEDQEEK